ncbi:MAG: hypothetical protein AB1801_21160 [Chloroflexota bacterium]
MKPLLTLIFVGLTIVACGSRTSDRLLGDKEKVSVTPTPPSLQNVQINQTTVLPPYGIKVRADVASLKLRVSSSEDALTERLETIQTVVDHLSELAANSETVNLQYITVNQVSSSSDRGTAVPYLSERFDSSSVIIALQTDLTEHNHNLLKSLTVFNNFLNTLTLPETITLDTVSIEAEISRPEAYRDQLIAKVYQELEAIQAEYGQTVKFEITGLHSGLQTIPLTDTEYYLYIEPSIVVTEF